MNNTQQQPKTIKVGDVLKATVGFSAISDFSLRYDLTRPFPCDDVFRVVSVLTENKLLVTRYENVVETLIRSKQGVWYSAMGASVAYEIRRWQVDHLCERGG